MHLQYFFNDIKNNIDFFLRNKLIISRKNYFEKSENKANVFKNEIQIKTFEKLKNTYNLELLNNTTIQNYLENLYFINLFDNIFSKEYKENISILDIGSKNWSYVKSEYIFFKNYSNNFKLNGIELDAYRLCTNLYSRYEIAKFHIQNLENTNYIVDDFLNHQQKYDFIIWILPFITQYPLVKWGLPLKYFKPEKMLLHAFNLLNKDGKLLIINQNKKEYEIQKQLNEQLNLKTKYFDEIDDIFNVFKNKRYCCLIEKI